MPKAPTHMQAGALVFTVTVYDALAVHAEKLA